MTEQEKKELELRQEAKDMQSEAYKLQSKAEWTQSEYKEMRDKIIDKNIDIAVAGIESLLAKNGEISSRELRIFIYEAVLYAQQH